MNREAIILAGGLGTRLKHLIPDLPKPMAPVNGKPFLSYILEELNQHFFEHVVLSVGYKSDPIVDYYGHHYKEIGISYSIEEEPLGTGGAIKRSLGLTNSELVFVINGDTFFEIDFNQMEILHHVKKSQVTLAAKPLCNFDRYGTISIEEGHITGFCEKQFTQKGLINGGIYLLSKSKLPITTWPDIFSFEKDFLEAAYSQQQFFAFISDGYFIDIGIPDDYARANLDFKTRQQ
jgi:D-glycero-alpha-D-manno-heptose 1-phosphate guanylyltransferase